MRWSLALAQFVAVLVMWIGGASGLQPWEWCPCTSPDMCIPLPADHQFQVEVIVFDHGGTDYQHYDWSKITVVVLDDRFSKEILCTAHANNVRILMKGTSIPQSLVSKHNRQIWINRNLGFVKTLHMDGIFLELRDIIKHGTTDKESLTHLINETTKAFHHAIAGSQSQMWNECFAKANAPYGHTYSGLSAYINLGIDSRKLVMGVPWYGYDYPCKHFIEPGRCKLEPVPVQGAPCSSEVAKQIPYKEVMEQLPKSLTGRYWDDNYKSPYYVYKANNIYHEVWYDDPESISLKSTIMKKLKLGGIGVWFGAGLNYSFSPKAAMQTEDMWNALCPVRKKWTVGTI
ncbi:di-N-acetylchitobiase-like isoform X2 [Scyliorhinus canicula]|uniref:di-N-acetylchitobiase-like isoform X2 n=1 Tax=Scyliorhinus canicula TaxID=7830 RepID=UPI0018F60594|nr:di-N-acetylchitobiase-like isoform X2 [Scyliorhinus canicula]